MGQCLEVAKNCDPKVLLQGLETSKVPKVVRRGCKRCFGPREQRFLKSLLHHQNPVLHRCNSLLHQCKRPLAPLAQKTFLHPLLTTLGTFEVSGPCSRTFGSQAKKSVSARPSPIPEGTLGTRLGPGRPPSWDLNGSEILQLEPSFGKGMRRSRNHRRVALGQGCLRALSGEQFIPLKVGLKWFFFNGLKWVHEWVFGCKNVSKVGQNPLLTRLGFLRKPTFFSQFKVGGNCSLKRALRQSRPSITEEKRSFIEWVSGIH